MKKHIQFITCVHGNESTPKSALDAMGTPYILANPLATQYGVRFVHKDLNASFGTNGTTYEEQLSKEILRRIPPTHLVVDLHTMPVISQPFVIITKLGMIPFAKTLGIPHIVYMKYNMKLGHALIDFCNGVSVETGTHGTHEAFMETQRVVARAKEGRECRAVVYEVYGEITTYSTQQNFTVFTDGQESYYPVLAGIRTYDFLGLKARIRKEI